MHWKAINILLFVLIFIHDQRMISALLGSFLFRFSLAIASENQAAFVTAGTEAIVLFGCFVSI